MPFKINTEILFASLLLTTGVHSALAQTSLGITAASGQNIIYWSAKNTGTNGVLMSTTNLASPNWILTTDAIPVTYGSYAAVTFSNSASMRFFCLSLVPPTSDGMALIPAGNLMMGDPLDGLSDAIPTNVYVSAFYMDTNLVSYGQWQAVFTWATANGYVFANAGSGKGMSYPVQTVDWYDTVKWCNARSQQAGLMPIYYTDAGFTQVYTNGETPNMYANWMASGYRLPTEAEWEKAARGGLAGQRFPWGNTISESQANYYSYWSGSLHYYPYDVSTTSGYNPTFATGGTPYTSPVGSFAANGYGLYDMAGNVLEWCWDWYDTSYSGGTDPRGPVSSPFGDRVLRGGAWNNAANVARCAFRVKFLPTTASSNPNSGFRCVRRF